MKKIFALLCGVAMLCGFSGCSDKDDGNFTSADLIGKWLNTYSGYGYRLGDGTEYQYETTTPQHYLVFNEDGTGEEILGSSSSSFTWTLNGRVWVEMDASGRVTGESTIVRLTRTELELGYSNAEEWAREVYERVQ